MLKMCEKMPILDKFSLKYNIKGTKCLKKRHVRSPMFVAALTSFLFHMQNLFQNGANDISEMVNIISRFFVKKIQILCSLDHPILFKFCQLVEKIVRNYIVFWTYNVSNSNGNIKELGRKNPCKKWCSKRIFVVTVTNAHIGSLKF